MSEQPEPEKVKRGANTGAIRANSYVTQWARLVRRMSDKPMMSKDATSIAGHIWRTVQQTGADPETYDVETDIRRRLEAKQHIDPYKRLAQAAQGRTVSRWANLEWVHQNLLIDPGEIDPDTVPSAGAPAMLQWAKEEPKEFWRQFNTRLDVQEEKDDEGLILAEDSLSVDELLVQFMKLAEEQRAIDLKHTVL